MNTLNYGKIYFSKTARNMKYTRKIRCNNSDGSPTGHIGDSFFLKNVMMALKTSKVFAS